SGLGNASLRVDILESRTLGARTTFPIVFLIGSGREFSIKLIYRHDRIPATSAHAIVGDMAAVVEAIATQPDPTLEDLTTVIADDRVPLVYEHRPTLSSEMRRFVGPRDTVELQLALLWQDILGQGAI